MSRTCTTVEPVTRGSGQRSGMNLVIIAKTLMRYWRMSQDPRTPSIVRGLIYLGIAATVAPKKLRPSNVPGLGLIDEAALVPSVIALAMVLIPKRVRDEYNQEEKAEIQENKAEGAAEAKQAEHEAATAQLEPGTTSAAATG
jgi:uncharacterized membrane protein YkvA (DUF1232 family)